MPRSSPRPRPAPAVSLVKHFIAIVVVLIVAGCSGGGGCGGGCSSCGGITSLPNGFDATKRIENAGSVRLTQSGLTFLQTNLGALAKGLLGSSSMGGSLTFDIPSTPVNLTITTATVCPNGSMPNASPKVCVAEIDLGSAALTITPAGPYDLHVTGTVPIRVEDIQIDVPLGICDPTIDVEINANGSCGATTYDAFPLDVDVVVHVDENMNHTARFGFTALAVPQVVDATAANTNLTSSLAICNDPNGGICGSALSGLLGALKSTVVSQLSSQLTGAISTQIQSALCLKATATAPCPTGTTPDSGMVCRYADMTCAATLLGLDGNINLGGLLASISPGVQSGLDFLFAAGGADKNTNDPTMTLSWGDLDPANNGATLGMLGGAEADPLSKCVKLSNMTLPAGIPIPDELFANTVTNWPAAMSGPDVGIALSERFSNYALNSVYNSGTLCLGISTESIPLLSSGTLGLLAPSAKDLGLQHELQQVAIVIRPSTPPNIKFGNGTDLMTDPLIDVKLAQVSLDFYIFSLDRFIRFMTGTFDLDVPVNLDVGANSSLTPVINQIGVTNGVVTNSQLLREQPATIAAALGSLIGSLAGQAIGASLKPISLNSTLASLGVQLSIPPTVAGMGSPGLRKLSKGTDNYLGIFAALALPPPGPVPPPGPFGIGAEPSHGLRASHTNAEVTRKTVDRAGLKLATLSRDNVPTVELHLVSALDDGTRAVEFGYKIDEGFWHPWTRERFLTLRDDWLRVQGRHTVQVRSRVVGEPDSVDDEPATVEVVIDAEPPAVRVQQGDDGKITITATDLVTPDPLVRFRLDERAWSTWTLASRLTAVEVGGAHDIAVEAKDNEGNLGSAAQPLIRGRDDGVVSSSCGCSTVGNGGTPGGLWLLGIALAGVGARLVRGRGRRAGTVARRAAGGIAAVAFAASWAGCSCGNAQTNAASTGHPSSSSSTGSGYTCTGSCVSLSPGLIGEYSSAAVSGSTIWVAGYSEADWDNDLSYGDLVAGKWDGTKVAWDQVDGVPSTPPVDGTMFDLNGFRGGQTASGDDVGLWTSIAIGGDGNPAIAYYNRTNQALKFAQYDGKVWAVQQVDTQPSGDVGRYAKLLFLNGNFVIAYQSIQPGGTNGALISKVRIATSAGATPAAGSWAFEDAAVTMTSPCRASFCASGTACIAATKLCTATVDMSMCNPSCASGTACVAGMGGASCVTIFDANKLDAYPDAIGGYISIAPDGQGGFGVAYYDRTNGNLDITSKAGGKWTTKVVDGQDAMGHNVADVGIGTSLFIDPSGDWHITYVNGFTEAVQYVKVAKGTTVGTPEIIDDGFGVGGTPNADGQHLVGDDSHVTVLSSGEIHVTYQDATGGTLHHAVGVAAANGHTWTVTSPMQTEFAGAFSSVVLNNGALQLMNWWRVGGMSVKGDVRILSP